MAIAQHLWLGGYEENVMDLPKRVATVSVGTHAPVNAMTSAKR